MKRLVLSLFALVQMAMLSAAEQFISFSQQPGAFSLANATICYSDNDNEGVKIALRNLQTDMERVLGKAPQLSSSTTDGLTILVGTLGKNPAIDKMVNGKSANRQLSDLKGKREKFIITNVDGKVVIAGSDRRGTIYGIYELSRQLGVSPWYWWADAPIAKHDDVWFIPGTYTDGEPAVEFRGLFLNDEAPCLTSWVKNTWGTDYGDHRFYEKVFELILRLKGNFLWPAMWGWAFYADDPENGKTADRMGVIMGTSHHEPMARNHQEYARRRQEWGAWNYQTNQTKLDQFFREGIERMNGTEDIVTIGMRGDGDEAMSDKADTQLMERIITNQRKIIKEVTKKPAEKTTQVWALYKEVQDYYDAGLRVPDDVMILISDDNWGDIRRVPVNEKERARKGGWGIYYHVDYVGAPRNTKWLNVTQTQQMFEQLSLAYDFGIQRMWILNVGDLKPMEYPIQLFMDMAWNPKEYNLQNVTGHTRRFFGSVLSGGAAEEAAAIYNQNCQYMARVTPEMLDARTYNIETGEWKQVADDYQRLELRALRLYDQVPAEARDFYRQTILFPVQAMANLYDMYYAQAMNHYLARRNAPDANLWADRVAQCFRRDSLLCAAYNTDIAGGKWNGMMTQKHIGYRSWNDNFRRDMLPQTTTVKSEEVKVNSDKFATAEGCATATGGYSFAHSNGYVSMEAEHFYIATASEGTAWQVYPYYGRTRSALALTPYTKPVGDASLTYRFTLPGDAPDSVKVHVVVKSTLDFLNVGGHEYSVSLDGSATKTVNFNKTLVDRQPYMYSEFYPTIARRVVEKVVTVPVGKGVSGSTGVSPASGALHELTIHPCHPGIVFEKIVVDFGGYKPSYLFMDESEYTHEQKSDNKQAQEVTTPLPLREGQGGGSAVHNPMLWADVPDPDIIRVGDTYYLMSTTMHLMPGAPVMKSKDLRHWEIASYIFDRLTDSPKYDMQEGTVYGRGQWATSLKYHKGKFYVLFAPNEAGDMGQTYICTAEKAEGPWTVHSRLRHFHDASLFFDDDDRVYVVYGTGELVELNKDLTDVIEGSHRQIFQREEDERGLLEGSRMLKHNGKYYLQMISHVFAPGRHRREVCYRADDIRGPYEKKVILESDFGGFPYVGQGTAVDGPNGEWYAVIFQDRGGVGRVPLLMPCTWKDGWPMLGDSNGKVPETISVKSSELSDANSGSKTKVSQPSTLNSQPIIPQQITLSDDFSAKKLNLCWQWNHNPVDEAWSLNDRPGFLRLKTSRVVPNLYLAPNTLTQRMEGPTCSGVISIDISHMKDGDLAGISAFNGDSGVLTIKCEGNNFTLEMSEQKVSLTDREKAVTNVEEKVIESVVLEQAKKIWLRVDGDFQQGHGDAANFFYSMDGKEWKQIGTKNYRMVFDYRRFFMGSKFGIFCYATKATGGYVDIDEFKYSR